MSRIKKELSAVMHALFATKKMKVFSVWLILIIFLCISWVFTGKPNEVTVAVSIFVCAATTLAFWLCRKAIAGRVERWRMKPWKKFVLIGGVGALWVEFLFWFFEKVFGAHGVAASPNLLIDYVATMPWYILMVLLLWKVQTRYSYSMREVLILGGIYELGADGFIGPLFKGALPVGFLHGLIGMPIFVIVYSVMIIPPTYLMRRDKRVFASSGSPPGQSSFRRYAYALLPLAGLIPYLLLFFLWTIATVS